MKTNKSYAKFNQNNSNTSQKSIDYYPLAIQALKDYGKSPLRYKIECYIMGVFFGCFAGIAVGFLMMFLFEGTHFAKYAKYLFFPAVFCGFSAVLIFLARQGDIKRNAKSIFEFYTTDFSSLPPKKFSHTSVYEDPTHPLNTLNPSNPNSVHAYIEKQRQDWDNY